VARDPGSPWWVTNDCPRAAAACSQQGWHPTKVASWTRIFAASARLNWANAAGVPNPAYPDLLAKGKDPPPARRSACASFIRLEAASMAAEKLTKGAGSAVMGRSTSMGVPN